MRYLKFCALAVALSILAVFTGACRESQAHARIFRSSEKLARQVILENNCGRCHTLQARGLELTGKIGPDLTRQGLRDRSPEWLKKQLTNPISISNQEVVSGFEGKQKLMPRFDHLSERELETVVEFLRSLE